MEQKNMSKTVKLRCERRENGRIFIVCPFCRGEQELPLGDGWYDVAPDGKVSPIFVCMKKSHTRRYNCFHECYIWIINW